MKRARKLNRISWAPNLCQLQKQQGMKVKLFLSDDCPSKVGMQSQDHLQAKTSPMLPSSTNECDDDLPPGFEGNHFVRQSNTELPHISQIKWKCPPLFACSNHWCVAAGEESREKDSQKLREMRVLEAVYPRLSAIPPSPFVTFEVQEEDYDDNLTPLIPMIPIEEEESMDFKPEVAVEKLAETPTNLQLKNMPQYLQAATSPINSQCKSSSTVAPSSVSGKPLGGVSPCSDADFAAASAVAAAIMKSNEQGSLLDMELLLKIFNDPTMIGKLINQHGTAASTANASSNTLGIPTSALKPVASSAPLPASGPKQTSPSEPLWGRTTFEKPTIPSVPMLTSTFDKPATLPPVPLFRPLSGISATSHSVTPPLSSMSYMQRPANQNIPPMSNGFSTQPATVLPSGVKRAAPPLVSVSSNKLSTVALPFSSAATKQVQSTSSTMPYQQGTGPSAFAVKDSNYYKNLIRQHGADKHDIQDSQIGTRHNNLPDLKSVHNIKQGEVMFKTQKPCIYFNGPRGCRNGSNCPYQHDMSAQLGAGDVLMTQSAKRVKLGPEIKRWI